MGLAIDALSLHKNLVVDELVEMCIRLRTSLVSLLEYFHLTSRKRANLLL